MSPHDMHTNEQTTELLMQLLQSTTRLEAKMEDLTLRLDRKDIYEREIEVRLKALEQSKSKIIGMATAASVFVSLVFPFLKGIIV